MIAHAGGPIAAKRAVKKLTEIGVCSMGEPITLTDAQIRGPVSGLLNGKECWLFWIDVPDHSIGFAAESKQQLDYILTLMSTPPVVLRVED